MSLCGYARVLRGQSPLPRSPRHGRGPFTPCHPRRSFNYSSLPLDVYRPCTEQTRADNYNHSRGPRSDPLLYRANFSIRLSLPFSSYFLASLFLFFFTILDFKISKELGIGKSYGSVANIFQKLRKFGIFKSRERSI